MATTTNYGWTTPDDTALVKDGAAAIRTLGSSVDTTTKALNPSTTLGDIEYRSSTANTNTRLGIGSTNQVLTVAGGVPTWATPAAGGGMTLLSTTTLSGATTTISSIDQTYKSIVLYFFGVNAGTGSSFFVNPNANTILVSQITNYGENGSTYAITHNDSKLQLPGNLGTNRPNNAFTLQFDNYASTTAFKPFNFYGYYEYHSPAIEACFHSGGAYRSTSAISSIDINIASGTFSAGTVLLYGVN